MQPLVSVYCLAFNHEKYIRNALDGFISQRTTFPFEVFVHDDASSDNTASIIREYEEKYPNIIKGIYQKENQHSKGIAISTSIIFPRVKGKYIAVCEGDDYWTDPYKLQKQADFLETHKDYSACVHNTYEMDLRKNKTRLMYEERGDHDVNTVETIQGGMMAFHTSSIMYRVQYALHRPSFFDVSTVGDYPLSVYLTMSGKVRFLDEAMSVYRRFTEGSWTSTTAFNKERLKKLYETNNQMLELANKYSNFKYDEEIRLVMLKNDYIKNEFLENYSVLKDKKFKGLWKDMDAKFRLKRFLYRNFGKIMNKIR